MNSQLEKFEKLILMALKKKEINTQISKNIAADEDMVVIPVPAFKQVLGQLGLNLPESVSKIIINL